MQHTTDRYPALDGLRGIAAIAVAAHDLYMTLGLRQGAFGAFSHGYLAADFFFCLSGFVLARAYAQHWSRQRTPIRAFLLARSVRLLALPALVAIVACLIRLAFVQIGTPIGGDSMLRLLANLPFGVASLPGISVDPAPSSLFPLNPSAWFICVEMIVCALWATLLWRAGPSTLMFAAVLCALALLPSAVMMNTMDFGGQRTVAVWLPLARGLLSFLLGSVLWHVSQGKVDADFHFEHLALVLFCLLWLPIEPGVMFDFAAITMVFPLIVLFGAEAKTWFISEGGLKALGDMSFPLFILHMPLLLFGQALGQDAAPGGPLVAFPIILIAWMAVAWLVRGYAEVPARALQMWIERHSGMHSV